MQCVWTKSWLCSSPISEGMTSAALLPCRSGSSRCCVNIGVVAANARTLKRAGPKKALHTSFKTEWHAGRGENGGDVTMTNSSWRMLQWMSDYADLMRMLRTDSGKIYSCCCELFELYFLHVFHTFSDVPLAEIAGALPARQVQLPAREA